MDIPAVKIALIQMQPSEHQLRNLERATQFIDSAAKKGAKIVCLPELFLSPYFCQEQEEDNFSYAEEIPNRTTDILGNCARDLGIVLIASIFEKVRAGLYFNTALVINTNGDIIDIYRKMHIPNDTGYHESFYFTHGDLGYRIVETEFGKIAVLICYDQWFPEAARLAAMKGADIIFYPTSIGWDINKLDDPGQVNWCEAWKTVQRGHAVANSIYVASVNRVGTEMASPGNGGIRFWGSSFIAGPQGEILGNAAQDAEEIIIADIDLSKLTPIRQEWPFFKDRRIDSYHSLLKRWDG